MPALSIQRASLSLCAALLVLMAAPAQGPASPVHHLIRIPVRDAVELEAVLRLELDLVRERALELPLRALEVVAAESDLARIRAAGFTWDVLIEDMERFYAGRLAALPAVLGPTPPFGSGSMGGYHTLPEVLALMDDLHRAFPAIVSARWSIGKSHEGRDLWAQKISDNVNVDEDEPEALFDAMQHAREPMGMELTFALMFWLAENYAKDALATYLVNERELFFVPVCNPDGYEHNRAIAPGGGGMWRKNRRDNGGGVYGVDLNRNWPYQWGGSGSSATPSSDTYRGPAAGSEPEVQALTALILARSFTLGFTSHSYQDLLLRPWGYAALDPANAADYDMICSLATRVNKFPYGACGKILYLAAGGAFDAYHALYNMYGLSPEIGSSADGFWPPTSRIVPLIDRNLWMFQALALAAGAAVSAEVTAVKELSGNANGSFEPGETVGIEVSVTNSGVRPAAAAVIADLTRVPPGAAILNGRHDFGKLAAFAKAANGANLLAFQLPAGASGLQAVEITLQGAVEPLLALRLPVGLFRLLARESAEEDLGWSLGVPGDTATTGRWTRMAPQQTSSGAQVTQPGADTTPPPGTQCFVTDGRAGSSAGTYDIDGGCTTLLSPILDLSHAALLRIRYQRWFVDTGNTDLFRISVSDDGGGRWAALEELPAQPSQWIQAQGDLPAGVAPTARMRFRFVAEDDPANPSVVEACVDDFELWGVVDGPSLVAFASGQGGTRLLLCSAAGAGQTGVLLAAAAAGRLPIPGFGGVLGLDPGTLLIAGTVLHDSGGYASIGLPIPADPALRGATVFFQGLALAPGGGSGAFSNTQALKVP